MSATDIPTTFDPQQAEAFANKMMTVLNDGALALMISIGHRVGLFDRLRDSPPATSVEIAEGAGLHERYVREWLGAMVTGGVVRFDPGSGRYALPAEHAAFLTRAAAADNLAVFCQTSACSARWRTRSCAASARAAACRTSGTPASTR